jgi:hypothetical protein
MTLDVKALRADAAKEAVISSLFDMQPRKFEPPP